MYCHVCETGGTIEVLLPRPSKRFKFKGLIESQKPTSQAVCWTNYYNTCLRLRPTVATKQDRRDQRGARVWYRLGARMWYALALLHMGVWRHISLIQVKAQRIAPRAISYFLSLVSIQLSLGQPPPCLPTFATKNT